MAAPHNTVANAVRAVLAGVSGAPSTVQVRKTDDVKGREKDAGLPLCIVTLGKERTVGYHFGGIRHCAWEIGVSLYRANPGNTASDLTANPELVAAMKNALDTELLSGASFVRGVEIIDNPEWEGVDFGNGAEVSRFRIDFYGCKPRTANP